MKNGHQNVSRFVCDDMVLSVTLLFVFWGHRTLQIIYRLLEIGFADGDTRENSLFFDKSTWCSSSPFRVVIVAFGNPVNGLIAIETVSKPQKRLSTGKLQVGMTAKFKDFSSRLLRLLNKSSYCESSLRLDRLRSNSFYFQSWSIL